MDHRRSEVRGNILQLNLNIFRTQSIMLTTMLRKKILMIKELYKTENMCFCQSIFIQLVHVFNQKWSKLAGNLKSVRKCVRLHIDVHIYMIKTQAAHQQFQSFLLPPFCLNSSCASFILNPLWVSFFVTHRRQDLLDFAGFTGFATLVSVVYVPV